MNPPAARLGDVRLYGGCPFPLFKSFQIHQHPLFQQLIPEAFAETGTLERRTDHLAGIIRGRIDNAGVGYAVVLPPDLFRLDVECGKQCAVFSESLETVAFQYGFKGVAYLMADIPKEASTFFSSAFGFRLSVSAPLRKPKSVSSSRQAVMERRCS